MTQTIINSLLMTKEIGVYIETVLTEDYPEWIFMECLTTLMWTIIIRLQ